MQFIVMDLEWNTTYSRKLKGFINEIIEIGAVKLDEQLHVLDTFSAIVRAQIGKKLNGRVRRLTRLSNEEMLGGVPFTRAVSEFRRWLGGEENVFFSWGDGDMRTLIKNYAYFMHRTQLPFVDCYCDAQRYCQAQLGDLPGANQAGLSEAALRLGVDPEDFPHHRALDDSLLTTACLQKVYDAGAIRKFIQKCDRRFYEKLEFKPRLVRDIHSPLIDSSQFDCVCDVCGGKLKQKSGWRFEGSSFRADFHCPKCKRGLRVSVRFKQYFDRMDIKRTVTELKTVRQKNSDRP